MPKALSPDQSQILVPEGHGVAGAPFEVGENLEVGEIDFGPQRTGPAPGDGHDLVQNGNIAGLQGVTSRTEGVVRPSLVKKDGRLALPDRQIGPSLISPDPSPGIRWIIWMPLSSNHSMFSKKTTLFIPIKKSSECCKGSGQPPQTPIPGSGQGLNQTFRPNVPGWPRPDRNNPRASFRPRARPCVPAPGPTPGEVR